MAGDSVNWTIGINTNAAVSGVDKLTTAQEKYVGKLEAEAKKWKEIGQESLKQAQESEKAYRKRIAQLEKQIEITGKQSSVSIAATRAEITAKEQLIRKEHELNAAIAQREIRTLQGQKAALQQQIDTAPIPMDFGRTFAAADKDKEDSLKKQGAHLKENMQMMVSFEKINSEVEIDHLKAQAKNREDWARFHSENKSSLYQIEGQHKGIARASRQTTQELGFWQQWTSGVKYQVAGIATGMAVGGGIYAGLNAIVGLTKDWLDYQTKVGESIKSAAEKMATFNRMQPPDKVIERQKEAAKIAAEKGINLKTENVWDTVQSLQSTFGGDYNKGLEAAKTTWELTKTGVANRDAQEIVVLGASQKIAPEKMGAQFLRFADISSRNPQEMVPMVSSLRAWNDPTLGLAAGIEVGKGVSPDRAAIFLRNAGEGLSVETEQAGKMWKKLGMLHNKDQMARLEALKKKLKVDPNTGRYSFTDIQNLGIRDTEKAQGIAMVLDNLENVKANQKELASIQPEFLYDQTDKLLREDPKQEYALKARRAESMTEYHRIFGTGAETSMDIDLASRQRAEKYTEKGYGSLVKNDKVGPVMGWIYGQVFPSLGATAKEDKREYYRKYAVARARSNRATEGDIQVMGNDPEFQAALKKGRETNGRGGDTDYYAQPKSREEISKMFGDAGLLGWIGKKAFSAEADREASKDMRSAAKDMKEAATALKEAAKNTRRPTTASTTRNPNPGGSE